MCTPARRDGSDCEKRGRKRRQYSVTIVVDGGVRKSPGALDAKRVLINQGGTPGQERPNANKRFASEQKNLYIACKFENRTVDRLRYIPDAGVEEETESQGSSKWD